MQAPVPGIYPRYWENSELTLFSYDNMELENKKCPGGKIHNSHLLLTEAVQVAAALAAGNLLRKCTSTSSLLCSFNVFTILVVEIMKIYTT